MAQVSGSNPQRKILEGKPNQVLGVKEVKILAFQFTDSAGQVDVGIALCFGTDEDGGPGVYVIPPARLKDLMVQPYPHIKKGLRKHLASLEQEADLATGPDELPSFNADGE